MKVVTSTSPFGSATRTRVLLALEYLSQSYPRELARLLESNLSPVQRALASLELDGLVSARTIGRTRLYTLNPRATAAPELRHYLRALVEAEPDFRNRLSSLRRRPRRTGKPI